MSNKFTLRFEFEYGEESCILDTRVDSYHYPKSDVLITDYNFTWQLARTCRIIADLYDGTINTSDPHGGLYLDPEFIKIFIDLEKYIYNKLMKEQGDKYDIIYNMSWIRRDYENNLPTEPVLIRH
jgi:hypothetical protein